MNKHISKKHIKNFSDEFDSCNHCQVTMNALTRSKLEDVSMRWDSFRLIDHHYSHVVKNEIKKVTNQKASGRCWGFAALNLMRLDLAKKYNLKNFEFSQSHFMFYDKLEKSNYFLENIIKTAALEFDDRLVMWLLESPIQDGGQWDMFVNLIEKYGVVPQSVMPESVHSSSSRSMNQLITRTLRKFASILRSKIVDDKLSLKEIREIKIDMMETIYKMLCDFIGRPPEVFNWQARDKKNNFIRYENITPGKFYKDFVSTKLKNKICLIHCPMSNKKMNTLYTVEYLGNVVEGQKILYLNISIDEMKKYTVKSLISNEAVWFGCDVGKKFHRDLGVMDNDLYDYESLFGINTDMDKQIRLEYGDSQMTHAMLFTGVDIVDNKSNKWRVENSWGNKSGDKGFFLMTDDWFSEYNYEVVIDKKYLPKKILDLFNKKVIKLSPWDPMGALAK